LEENKLLVAAPPYAVDEVDSLRYILKQPVMAIDVDPKAIAKAVERYYPKELEKYPKWVTAIHESIPFQLTPDMVPPEEIVEMVPAVIARTYRVLPAATDGNGSIIWLWGDGYFWDNILLNSVIAEMKDSLAFSLRRNVMVVPTSFSGRFEDEFKNYYKSETQ
jgi:hypothetical protein